ncbi:MAG: M14-type cytosolic carboxypeptidase [Planctomycetaceae bacterium]
MPSRMVMRVCVCLILNPYEMCLIATELRVVTDFPGGSAEVVQIDRDANCIEITPAMQFGRGWPCWWYLRVDGAQAGAKMTVVVHRAAAEFRPGQRLSASWALPERVAFSADNVHWAQTQVGTITAERGTYDVVAPSETFWLAWGPPFLPSHAEDLVKNAQQRVPSSERLVLATTLDGHEVPLLHVGTSQLPNAIWVQARQHAWEAGGSWVGAGFLDWITSDAPDAKDLRRTTEIWFIPIMDVDNVLHGSGGKEALPRDQNRDWSDEPHYPEVRAAQQHLHQLQASGRLRLFLDLHNPGPGDKQPYFYGPFEYEQLASESQRRYDQFLRLAIERIRDPLPLTPNYRFATYVTTDEERGRMSSEWVRRHTSPDVVAMTLETSWNTPHSTVDGYRAVGRGLAETVADFLADQ